MHQSLWAIRLRSDSIKFNMVGFENVKNIFVIWQLKDSRHCLKIRKSITCYCKFRNFREGFYFHKTSHMRSFVKIEPSRYVEITLSITDIGKPIPSHKFLTSQISLFKAIHKNKILRKISEFTVYADITFESNARSLNY